MFDYFFYNIMPDCRSWEMWISSPYNWNINTEINTSNVHIVIQIQHTNINSDYVNMYQHSDMDKTLDHTVVVHCLSYILWKIKKKVI